MTTNHTPGPWACTYTSNHAHDYRLSRIKGPLPLTGIANDHSEQRANARLIAAAPDLLAALEDLDFCIGNGCRDASWNEACDRMQAAIAKAKGV